jgi:hypothetical protein
LPEAWLLGAGDSIAELGSDHPNAVATAPIRRRITGPLDYPPMNPKKGTVLMLLACVALLPACAQEEQPARERIPIHAWIGPPAEETTPERYRELAECGFTQSFTFFPSADAAARALDVAHAAGVRLIVSAPELRSDPEGTVRRFMRHPALAGYHLQDEPSANDFPALAAWVKRIQAVDPEHGCYINLFPNYATPQQLGTATYREHVERFVEQVPVPYLSFDHYPVTKDGLRPGWYENLEIVAAAAREAKKPLWAFVLAVAHDPYPIAQLSHMRLQAFSNLAYGAECIQYFTYWTPESTVWNFHQAPIDKGKRTEVYDRVRQLNAEIQGLAPVFAGARVVHVGHTAPVPRGAQPYRPESPVVEVRAEGALVSLLEKGRSRFLVIVNRSHERPMPLTVRLDRPASEVRKSGGRSPFQGELVTRVGAGDVVVIQLGGR